MPSIAGVRGRAQEYKRADWRRGVRSDRISTMYAPRRLDAAQVTTDRERA